MMKRLLERYGSIARFLHVLTNAIQVREGFIIDDEDDEEPEERERRRKKDRKRRRAEREEEEAVLDEEDLDLIGEANPEWERKTAAQVRQKNNLNYPPEAYKSAAQAQATKAWSSRRRRAASRAWPG